MAVNYIISGSILSDIADSIRSKTGESGTIKPSEMAGKIGSIPGGSVTLETLNVGANGTYNSPAGKAYDKVIAAVPNTYSAGDNGKVVENGALVSQTARSLTDNGTYDTTKNNSVTVNVAGHGYATGTLTLSANATLISFDPGVGFSPSVVKIFLQTPSYGANGSIGAAYIAGNGSCELWSGKPGCNWIYMTYETRGTYPDAALVMANNASLIGNLVISGSDIKLPPRSNTYPFLAGTYTWAVWE